MEENLKIAYVYEFIFKLFRNKCVNFFLNDMQTKVPKSEVMDASCPYLRSRVKKRITKNSRNDW